MTPNDKDPLTTGKIAYLVSHYPMISHTFILREVEGLRKLGIDVTTCSIREPRAEELKGESEQKALRTTFYVLQSARRPINLIWSHARCMALAPTMYFSSLMLAFRIRPPGLKALLYQLFYFAEAGVLADYLRRNNVTHLHNHFGSASCSVAMLASAITGISFSFTEHGPTTFFEPNRWRLDEKIARARFVAAISHFCRSQLMLFSDPAYWDKIAIVHCGVEPHLYGRRSREVFGQRLFFVGRLDPVKGVPILLEAFAAIGPAYPDAHLTIVGDGAGRAALEAQAVELNLGASVTFAGYRTQGEVAEMLEGADMLILPSFAEGVPVVLMEAMASRIPVIASQVAGIAELVQDGVSGFLVPPGDVVTLSNRMERLLMNPDLCAQMGAAGREIVEREFSIAREVGRLRGLIFDAGSPDN